MVTLLTIIHITVCLFLILVVLLQAGKGGGMGIAFGGAGSQTVFGSSGAGNFLTRLTSITATIFLLTSLALAHYSSRQDSKRLQELASQKAAEKKSDDEKAAKLKADMEKMRSAAGAASVAKDGGSTAATPTPHPGSSSQAPMLPLQLKLPGAPAAPGTGRTTVPKTEVKTESTGAPSTDKDAPKPVVRRRKAPLSPAATPPAGEALPTPTAPQTSPPPPAPAE
jgi:preprotein translocase subunit SecG